MKKSKPKNQLVPVGSSAPALYQRMQIAIAECHSLDDCKHLATQAAAIAAYYQQIKDDQSVKRFLQIKLRAWRRIGEILSSANVDRSECEYTLTVGQRPQTNFNTAEYIRRLRAAFKGVQSVEQLSDSAFRQALKLAELPKDFFDKNVANHNSIDDLISAFAMLQHRMWEATPEGQAELKRREASRQKWEKEYEANAKAKREEEANKQAEKIRREHQQAAEVQEWKDALKACDIPADPAWRREYSRQIVCLVTEELYSVLRRAASDHQTTMQLILRSGLALWFVAHGYTIPASDMQFPQSQAVGDKRRPLR